MPELRATVDGPQVGDEPAVTGARHPALQGFAETDILPFGGRIEVVRPAAETEIPATFVPPFPIYPPELAWMRQPRSNVPALALHTPAGGGRVAYLAADLDRCFGRDNLPDHADLLANLARWVAAERIPLRVTGPGLIDCRLYRQPGRLILHLVNLTSAGAWRAPVHEFIPVGPLQISMQLPADVRGQSARALVAGGELAATREDGWLTVAVPAVTDHEVVVAE